MSIRHLQRAAAAGRHLCFLAVLDRSAPAFAPLCDGVVVQTA
jgi:hypothetical protein